VSPHSECEYDRHDDKNAKQRETKNKKMEKMESA